MGVFNDFETGIRGFLRSLDIDVNKGTLPETPERMYIAYKEMLSGYKENVELILSKTFEQPDISPAWVVLTNIEFTSVCEHHMLPFAGKVNVGYIPNEKIVGISKLARLVGVFSKRLQLQERLTSDILRALDKHVKPQGSACKITAVHQCMSCRGVNKNAPLITTGFTGICALPVLRKEFLDMA